MAKKPDEVITGQDDIVEENQAVSEGIEPLEPGENTEDALITKLKNDYLYLRAEFDNYKKHALKERADLLRYGGERLALDLLQTLDIFETALAAETTKDNFTEFIKGIELTAQQLNSTLEKHGIRPVSAVGEPFDPAIHEALTSEENDTVPPGHITRIFKKPYKYHDKLLRPGQVVVASDKK